MLKTLLDASEDIKFLNYGIAILREVGIFHVAAARLAIVVLGE